MTLCTAQFRNRLSGSVQAVHTVVGVATDDYEALINKPSINGVALSGDLTLDALGHTKGAYFYTSAVTAGDAENITFEKDDIRYFGGEVSRGNVVLTADRKLFVISYITYGAGGKAMYTAQRFADLDGGITVSAEGDSIIINTAAENGG